MGNSVNELIEKIGGRHRLESVLANPTKTMFNYGESLIMARALLAVLDAKPVGTVSIVPDWNSIPRRNIATVNMRPDLVMSEMRDGDNLYTNPPEASALEPEIYDVAKALCCWIDAMPENIAAALPAMPGVDRDWVDSVIAGRVDG